MIAKIKEWLSEFRPHLVTDGKLWAVRKRTLIGLVYFQWHESKWVWLKTDARHCFTNEVVATSQLARLQFFQNLRKVDPKNPVRLVEGGEK